MKRVLPLLLLLAVISCHVTRPDSMVKTTDADFTGSVRVKYQGEYFDNPDIAVKFALSEDKTEADITIYHIKFVPKMPVTIDVTIPSVSVNVSETAISFSGHDIAPLALGGEMPKYLVTNLVGSIEGDDISFSLYFGEYPTSYSGKKKAL